VAVPVGADLARGGVFGAAVDLDETDAPFHQPACQQALPLPSCRVVLHSLSQAMVIF
jgi:hypothetical protein